MIADFEMGCLCVEDGCLWCVDRCVDMRKGLTFCGIYPIGNRWELGMVEGGEVCKLCGSS